MSTDPRGRGKGVLVGAGFGAGWALAAAGALPSPWTWVGRLAAAVIGAGLLGAGLRLALGSPTLPDAETAVAAERRRVRSGFRRVAALEAAALLLAVGGLVRYGLQAYLPAAIALIVGLHFYPLARVFRVRAYLVGATAMTAAAAVALVGLTLAHGPAAARAWDAGVEVASAVALWGTCAVSLAGGTHTADTCAGPAVRNAPGVSPPDLADAAQKKAVNDR